MTTFDPDDTRAPFQQVAAQLRRDIATGHYPPGAKLPSYAELARSHGVAQMTAQNAVRVLRDEGWLISRKGVGSFVRERATPAVSLRPHLERALGYDTVDIAFAGFSAETLHNALAEPLDKVRLGHLRPASISLRILLPDMSRPMALPSRAPEGTDDEGVRARAEQITRRSTQALAAAVSELHVLERIAHASTEVRVHGCPPLFKLYLLGREEAFFGFYPVREHPVRIGGEDVPIYDPMGKDAVLFRYSVGEPGPGADYIQQAHVWFDSMWNSVAHEYLP